MKQKGKVFAAAAFPYLECKSEPVIGDLLFVLNLPWMLYCTPKIRKLKKPIKLFMVIPVGLRWLHTTTNPKLFVNG